jgi:hypothetical protein
MEINDLYKEMDKLSNTLRNLVKGEVGEYLYIHDLLKSSLVSEEFKVELRKLNLAFMEKQKDAERYATNRRRHDLTNVLESLDKNLEASLKEIESRFRIEEFGIPSKE